MLLPRSLRKRLWFPDHVTNQTPSMPFLFLVWFELVDDALIIVLVEVNRLVEPVDHTSENLNGAPHLRSGHLQLRCHLRDIVEYLLVELIFHELVGPAGDFL